jgi:hypothetical protein
MFFSNGHLEGESSMTDAIAQPTPPPESWLHGGLVALSNAVKGMLVEAVYCLWLYEENGHRTAIFVLDMKELSQ